MSSSIKIVRCLAPGKLVFGDQAARDHPPEGWALIDVSHVGICGTDFHIFEGKHPYLVYPRVMGHEVSGTVAAINGPAEVSLGQEVIINPYLSCGKCVACQQAKPNCCVSIGRCVKNKCIGGCYDSTLKAPDVTWLDSMCQMPQPPPL